MLVTVAIGDYVKRIVVPNIQFSESVAERAIAVFDAQKDVIVSQRVTAGFPPAEVLSSSFQVDYNK